MCEEETQAERFTIERLSEPRQLVEVAGYKDDFETACGFEKAQFIQFAQQHIDPRLNAVAVWIVRDEAGRLRGWLAGVNCVLQPICRMAMALYVHSTAGLQANGYLLNEMKAWAVEMGADKIVMGTKLDPAIFERYGFVRTDVVHMELAVKE